MFKFLKEKISKWTKKISEKAASSEGVPSEKGKETEKEPKKITVPAPKKEVPMKFNAGAKKYEPDLEKIKEDAASTEGPPEEGKEIEKESEETEEVSEDIPSDEGKEGFFSRLKSKVTKVKISEKDFEIYAEELEMLLIENNVALEIAEKIIQDLKEKIVGKELLKKEVEGEIKDSLKEIIEEILIDPFDIETKIKEKEGPYVILFCGINGSGKTTSVAKIAEQLKKQKISTVLAAADTFRAASIEQLKSHGEKIGVPVIAHEYGSDPAAVGFDAIKYAEKNNIDCVLIDTAGRMHTSKNLLAEIEKVARVCKPDLKIFVGESITGNDAIEQVRSFNFSIGIGGIILTKADIDEKGGTALSVGYATKKPILYLGTGQKYKEIEKFDKQKFIKTLGL